MKKGLLLFLCFISSFANASESSVICFKDNELDTAREIRQALNSQGNPYWSGEKLYDVPVVLMPLDSNIYPVLHVEKSALEMLGIATKPCKEDASFLAIVDEQIPDPANGSFDFYFPKDVRQNAVSKIASGISKFSMAFSLKSPWAEPVPVPRGTLARIAVHEAFHGDHQFGGGFFNNPDDFKKYPRKKAMACSEASQKSVWQQTFLQEMKLIENLSADWDSLSVEQIRERARSLLALRLHSTDPETKECYDQLSYIERIEGTAHYLDLQAGLRINAFENGKIPAKDALAGGPALRFYVTGATHCRILERLFPGQWQDRINRGERPVHVLIDLLGLKTII